METMKAAAIKAYGKSNLKLIDVPKPDEKSLLNDQLLVRIHCATLNPVDFKNRRGSVKVLKGKPSDKTPITLGYDGAGEVVAVGSAVAKFKVGDRVSSVCTFGSLCEYAVLYESNVAKIPENVTFAQAAALNAAGLTALQLMKECGAEQKGNVKSIFVAAGAGGVGHFVIQLAKNVYNVETVATTGSEKKVKYLEQLGADIVVDYTKTGDDGDFVHVLKEKKIVCDAAFDCLGQVGKCKKVVAPGGSVLSILGTPDGDMVEQITTAYHLPSAPRFIRMILNGSAWAKNAFSSIRTRNMVILPLGEDLEKLLGYCADGLVKPTFDKVFPFEKASDAMDYVEDGHVTGKVVVEIIPGSAQDVEQWNGQ